MSDDIRAAFERAYGIVTPPLERWQAIYAAGLMRKEAKRHRGVASRSHWQLTKQEQERCAERCDAIALVLEIAAGTEEA